MARLNLPKDFLSQQKLLSKLITKHNADGASSPLNAFLQLHNISLGADNVSAQQSLSIEAARQSYASESEFYTEKRNLSFKPVFGHLKGCLQFLKSFYKSSMMEVGTWGAPITSNGKINYPSSFLKQAEIFTALKTKYDNIVPPEPNPLLLYLTQNGISLDEDNTALQDALQFYNNASEFSRKAEKSREARDIIWNPVMKHVRDIGSLLMKLFSNNPKELFAWGFTVDHSPRPHRLRKTKVLLGAKKTLNGIIIGGTFTNTGTVDLLLHKGKTISNNPITVTPGEIIEIPKAYSIITVANTSLLKEGKFTVLTKG